MALQSIVRCWLVKARHCQMCLARHRLQQQCRAALSVIGSCLLHMHNSDAKHRKGSACVSAAATVLQHVCHGQCTHILAIHLCTCGNCATSCHSHHRPHTHLIWRRRHLSSPSWRTQQALIGWTRQTLSSPHSMTWSNPARNTLFCSVFQGSCEYAVHLCHFGVSGGNNCI